MDPNLISFFRRILLNSYLEKKRLEKIAAIRRIKLFYMEQNIKKKLKVYLVKYLTDIKNCQRFLMWSQKYL